MNTDDSEFLPALAAELRTEEGFRAMPYRDQYGNLTIGYGRNLDDHGLSEAEAAVLLANDIATAVEACRARFPWYAGLTPGRRQALADLCFNIGLPKLLGFQHMLAALAAGDFEGAAAQLEDSLWFHQVGSRGPRVAGLIRGAEHGRRPLRRPLPRRLRERPRLELRPGGPRAGPPAARPLAGAGHPRHAFTNAAGVASHYAFGSALLPSGTSAIDLLTSVLAAGAAAWKAGVWMDVSGVWQTMTFAGLQALSAAIEAADSS